MKKIGILTACRTNNNGTDLQTLAMQTLFSKYSDTEIINYKCYKLERSHRLLLHLRLADFLRIPYRLFMNISHKSFRKRYFRLSKKTYDQFSVAEVSDIYDAIVVGSDQIWNLKITGYDMNFFVPWGRKSVDKYAYAPSFGVSDITEWEKGYNIASYLHDFKCVTVREASGVQILKDIGIKAKEILDPLLAVDASLWKGFKKQHKGKPYILLYQVATGINEVKTAISYSRKQGWEIRCVKPPSYPVPGVKMCSFVTVEEWLSCIQNAEMVITDSYHGLSICVATHTNFRLVLMPQDQQNIRSLNLLKKLDLTEFILSERDMCASPNWEQSEEKLEIMRCDANAYVRYICEEMNVCCE